MYAHTHTHTHTHIHTNMHTCTSSNAFNFVAAGLFAEHTSVSIRYKFLSICITFVFSKYVFSNFFAENTSFYLSNFDKHSDEFSAKKLDYVFEKTKAYCQNKRHLYLTNTVVFFAKDQKRTHTGCIHADSLGEKE